MPGHEDATHSAKCEDAADELDQRGDFPILRDPSCWRQNILDWTLQLNTVKLTLESAFNLDICVT